MSLDHNSMNNVVLYPSDILDAVEYAKSINPKDKNGYSAFRIDYNKGKPMDTVTYYPFEVRVKGADGQYFWTPVNLKFVNLTHVGKTLPLTGGDNNRTSKKFFQVALLFKGNYEYTRAGPNRSRITEKYGLAKQLISKAFEAHTAVGKREGFVPKALRAIGNVKYTYKVTEGNKVIEKPLDTPNMNIGLRFAGKVTDAQGIKVETKPETKFQCMILDAGRQKDRVAQGEFPFHEAMLEDENGEFTIPVNNGNIHAFLRGGSIITGVESMKTCCKSNLGFSLPSYCDVIIVKKAVSVRVAPAVFADDFADIVGAETPAAIEEKSSTAPESADTTDFDNLDSETGDGFDGDTDF